jgi:hypothetical protein
MLQAVTGYLLQLPGAWTPAMLADRPPRLCPLDLDARRRVLGPDHPTATNSLGEVRRDLDLPWS